MRQYIPKPGSIPSRVIAWLEENHPDGTKVPGQVICEEIGIQPSAFPHNMSPATRAGLVRMEKLAVRDRLQCCFGLGRKLGPVPDARIAARVIQHLTKLPPGTQLNSQDLADAICVPLISIQNMKKKLKPPMQEKLRAQQVNGYGPIMFWSLMEFEPIDPKDDSEDMPPRRFAPEIQPRPGPFLPGVDVGMGARRITPVQIAA